jgi:hypothetical protein
MQRILLAFGFFIAFAACKTTKKTDWATECADRFPSRTDTFRVISEKVKVDTYFAPGMRVPYYLKTVCPPSDTVRIVEQLAFVDCPPSQTVIKTHTLHDSVVIFQANTAQEKVLKNQIDSLNSESEVLKRVNRSLKSELIKEKRQNSRLAWLSVIAWILVAFAAFVFYKIWYRNH